MELFRKIYYLVIAISFALFFNCVQAQTNETENKLLSSRDKSTIAIAVLTAKGDLVQLKSKLIGGLEAGLTINEIKEIVVHTYAYCGFPRSIRGLQTFMEVLEERKSKGIIDQLGNEATKVINEEDKYSRGKSILQKLTNATIPNTLSGYAAFAPIIDIFLKEHLFADIFERDVLSFIQREWVTISVISTIGEAEPMLKSHLLICLNLGVVPEQLKEFTEIIKPIIGKRKTKSAKHVLKEVLKSK
ncbi:MAG: carboxymuconolactone decarboxylase family protein [Flavobacterium sp.]|jgi:alkylhydroperoxidase/carboxymuconolactone decarboxylase family protein YurZ|nr:carboxymuconolactone decarboxylase family protein [Flavobacterium sp.]